MLTHLTIDDRPMLWELRRNAKLIDPWSGGLTSRGDVYTGLSLEKGERLLCDLPCAFGTSSGQVALTVRSDAGEHASETVEATYRTWLPGCGGTADDGTDLSLRLA